MRLFKYSVGVLGRGLLSLVLSNQCILAFDWVQIQNLIKFPSEVKVQSLVHDYAKSQFSNHLSTFRSQDLGYE